MYTQSLLLLLLLLLSTASCTPHLPPRQSITPLPECDVIPTWEMTNFLWYNSPHNLDCANPVDVHRNPNRNPSPKTNPPSPIIQNLHHLPAPQQPPKQQQQPLAPRHLQHQRLPHGTPPPATRGLQVPRQHRAIDARGGVPAMPREQGASDATARGRRRAGVCSAGTATRGPTRDTWILRRGRVRMGVGSWGAGVCVGWDAGDNAAGGGGETVVIPLLAYQIV
ncbi:hypothetical protein MFRU_014g02250 [Monilinia fructicola]|nr:hypothetical protein MFRU_014g02250 [Monilinia fructicola]